MNLSDMTILRTAGIEPDSPLAGVVATRGNIVEMSQSAEDAVLRPRDCGAFSHALRHAIAARVAQQAEAEELAVHYLKGAGEYAALAHPSADGADLGLAGVIGFVDCVANKTRTVSAQDILGLQNAGVSDPDIVRLCELVAFLAYQLRVISGLRLMKGA